MGPWKSRSRHKKTLESCNLTACVDEILYQIIDEVFEDGGDMFSLLSLAMTCRKCYVLCIPTIYRSITIDVSRWSHQRLLQRLIRPNSRLPGMIRDLSIRHTERPSEMRLLDLYILFGRLTHLLEFSWSGALYIPHYIMEILTYRFPNATFTLDATALHLGVSTSIALPSYTILAHPAGSQLTRFDFAPTGLYDFTPNLKHQLIIMLKHNKVLTYLRLQDEIPISLFLPEHLSLFQTGSFPPLRDFYLCADIFSERELQAWGARGGWSELRCLRVHRARQLLPILPHTTKLEELLYYPETPADVSDLHDYLDPDEDSTTTPPTLTSLRRVSYKVLPDPTIIFPDFTDPPAPEESPVPWPLLALTPQLEHLSMFRARFDYYLPGRELVIPSAADVARLRGACPRLKILELDVRLRGRRGVWPVDVVDELALFEEPVTITLYVHARSTRLPVVRGTLFGWDVERMFRRMVKKRRELGLVCAVPFKLYVKLVKVYSEMGDMWCVPDYTAWLRESGRVKVWRMARWVDKEMEKLGERQRMDGLTKRELDEEFGKGVRDAWRMGREIARRTRAMRGGGGSLYDSLMNWE